LGYAGSGSGQSGSGQSGSGQIQNIESEGLLGGSSVEEGVGQPAGVP